MNFTKIIRRVFRLNENSGIFYEGWKLSKICFFFVNEKLFGKRGNDGESLINRTILKDITLAQF